VIGVLGVHDDVRQRLAAGFATDGAEVVLLGGTREEFGGSAWAEVAHQHLGGRPPAVDFDAERQLAILVTAAAAAGVLASAHDLSDGGLAIALAEACLHGDRGCAVALPGDAFTALFSESAGRALVSVVPGREQEFAALAAENGVPATVLGVATGDTLTVEGAFEIPLTELRQVWTGTLPAIFG
jgi:phosphoribosylformylglycinamidine synthase